MGAGTCFRRRSSGSAPLRSKSPKIEASLTTAVEAALTQAGAQPVAFLVEGRDVALDADNPASEGLRPAVAKLDGVRLVGLGDATPRGVAAAQTLAPQATAETPAARRGQQQDGELARLGRPRDRRAARGRRRRPRAEFLESARRQAERLARSRAPSGMDAANVASGDQTNFIAVAAKSVTSQQREARLEAARDYRPSFRPSARWSLRPARRRSTRRKR